MCGVLFIWPLLVGLFCIKSWNWYIAFWTKCKHSIKIKALVKGGNVYSSSIKALVKGGNVYLSSIKALVKGGKVYSSSI